VEASDLFSKSLGVRLGGSNIRTSGGTEGFAFTGSAATTPTLGASTGVTLPSSGTEGGLFALSIFNAASLQTLNLEISAMESDNKGKVISSPRVVTADQTKALIEQGEELPYQVASSSGATAIQFRKANLKLEVTPQITPEGSIILTLDVNKDRVGRVTPGGFAINTTHIQTQALVENGGTIVIGGIFTEDQLDTVDKVPFFGDLPVVGWLFKRNVKSSNKQELLVFITPRVLSERSSKN
jgi:type IV pilus assembly protein PilQ